MIEHWSAQTVLSRSALLGALLAFPAAGHALTYTGSGLGTNGTPISATADFDLVTYDFGGGAVDALQITLTNTADVTDLRGNLLTGIFFNISDVGSLPTDATGFDGLAPTVHTNQTGTTVSNVDIAPAVNGTATDGTYQLVNGPFGIANDGTNFAGWDYGISTVGQGLGFNGSDVGGDDYGIFAPGSNLDGTNIPVPVIEGSATFWVAAPGELTSLDQLGPTVRFTYGSLPDNYFTGVPEPGAAALFGLGLAGLAWRGRKASRA